MQIAFHIGAHATDGDRLVRALLKNREVLSAEGIAVPGPARYREMFREVLLKLRGKRANAETQKMLIEELVDEDDAERLVLSSESFLCGPNNIFEGGRLYARWAEKAAWLRNLFPDHTVEFHAALRNPATFVPDAWALTRDRDLATFLAGTDPRSIRWAPPIAAMSGAVPDARITVWCNEDTPLLWPEVMRAVSGHGPHTQLRGGLEIAGGIMQKEGYTRLRAYLHKHPPATEPRRRRILAAFLERYAIDEAITTEIDLPGWTAELVDEITDAYDDDVRDVGAIPGVTVLLP